MKHIFQILQKLGIIRVGGGKAVGDAKKLNELNATDFNMIQSTKKLPLNMQSMFTQKSAIIWAVVLLVVWFLFNFWTALVVLAWKICFGMISNKAKEQKFPPKKSLGLKIGASVVLSFAMLFALSTIDTSSVENNGTISDTLKGDKQGTSQGMTDDVSVLLADVEDETGIDFSQPVDDDLSWPSQNVSLELSDAKSMIAVGMGPQDFDNLQKFFTDRGATTGGIGFEFVPPSGIVSSGYVFMDQNQEYYGLMCIFVAMDDDQTGVGCGKGPSYKE